MIIPPFWKKIFFPKKKDHRADYSYAVNICLADNYYQTLSNWSRTMEFPYGSFRPVQWISKMSAIFRSRDRTLYGVMLNLDLRPLQGKIQLWQNVPQALMVHLGQRRNSNELYGAYGHSLSYDEMVWLADWCFCKGDRIY